MEYIKKNGHIVKHIFNNKTEAKYWQDLIDRTSKPIETFAIQFAQDAAIMTLHELFGFGQDRIEKFCLQFVATCHELSDLIISDEKDDPDLVYTKAKIDGRVQAACGRNFYEFDVRYGKKKIEET